ncbi:MAG: hypothetical protein AAF378_03970 [Cyanobacteria bacterium P01_A01_bin.84]
MNTEKINQLQETLENKVKEAINNSDLGDYLVNQGLVENTLKLKVMLDLNQIRNQDVIKDVELKNSLREMPGEDFMILICCGCSMGLCCNCC